MRTMVKFAIVGVVGLIFILIGGIAFGVFPMIVENKIKDTMKIEKDGGMVYDTWKEVPVPMYMEYYFFHVVNAKDVEMNNAKPVLKETGPYTYREIRKKEVLNWDDEQDTVTYVQPRTYYFERELSIGNDNDLVTIPNVPLLSGLNLVRTQMTNMLGEFSGLLKERGATLYVTKTVKELLFDGYYDKLIKLMQVTSKQEILPNHTFAFFYQLNGTHDNEYTVYTGKKDVTKLAIIQKWNGSDALNVWKENSTCNDLNGTDGAQFPPLIKKDFRPYAFMSEACRSTYLVYEKEVEHFGITTYRFTSDINLFADPSVNPDNECFCVPKKCMFTGLFGVANCQRGAPIFTSNPHFYQADPMLLDMVEGLQPVKEKHEIVLDIEPMTGLVLNAARRVQMNIEMKPMNNDSRYWDGYNFQWGKMPQIYHPLLWFNERATIDDANVAKFKEMAVTPIKLGTGALGAVIGIGGIFVLVGIVGYCWQKKKNNRYPELPSKIEMNSR